MKKNKYEDGWLLHHIHPYKVDPFGDGQYEATFLAKGYNHLCLLSGKGADLRFIYEKKVPLTLVQDGKDRVIAFRSTVSQETLARTITIGDFDMICSPSKEDWRKRCLPKAYKAPFRRMIDLS